MTPAELSHTVLRAVRRAVDDGELGVGAVDTVERGRARIVVERPRAGGHGDYATNVALQLAGPAGRSPRQVAEVLSQRLVDSPGIAAVDVSGPGFLNLTLSAEGPGPSHSLLLDIRRHGLAHGHGDALRGHRIDLRIPREPRAEILADAVARIGRSQAADVEVAYADEAGTVTFRPVPADPRGLGVDAGRWALLHPAAHDRPRVESVEDRAHHLAQRESNPLFRVRYAHARSRALTRNAADLGFTSEPGDLEGDGRELLAVLAEQPRVLAAAARHRAPDRLARHLVEVADAFLTDARISVGALPKGEEKPSAAHRARLALAEAVGTVLAGGLTLLGIDAPAHL
ncbi:ArgS-related anticodon-binding protein NrtL [Streptomyces sp. NPDC102406]|uniref:ArgS-related anticodon-binding protein NrtL n=1 Tax=Streptomyces sp. NPDC102406 TaxID=3366171 RepID=UPI0037FA21BA